MPTLFSAPPEPALSSAADWLTGTLLGTVATALCVLAIAFVGFTMLSGRTAVRDGIRVVIGCFLLLGAPMVAAGLVGSIDRSPPEPVVVYQQPPAPLPSPVKYDPYATASLPYAGSISGRKSSIIRLLADDDSRCPAVEGPLEYRLMTASAALPTAPPPTRLTGRSSSHCFPFHAA